MLEEHGLILAIQAAHKARTSGLLSKSEEQDDEYEYLLPGVEKFPSTNRVISSSLEDGTASVVQVS
jgi:hypothetical protein